jgi:GNAT superfamily N-acetyltransferase
LVVELDETIVGYAFIRFEPDNFGDLFKESAWLHDIYFEKTARGKGIGKRFFTEVIKAAKSLGSESLMLTVSPHNMTAKKFFEQHGFRPTMQEMRLDFEIEE